MADEDQRQIARDPELEKARNWWREHGRPIVVGVAVGLAAVGGFNYWQNHQERRAEDASVLFERLRTIIEEQAEAKARAEAAAEAEPGDEAGSDGEAAGVGDPANEPDAESETDGEIAADGESEAAGDPANESGAGSEADDETPDDDPSESAVIESIAEELMEDYSATPYAAHGAFALARYAVDNGDLERAASALQWVLEHGDGDLAHVARLRLAAVLLARDKADAAAALLDVEDSAGFADRYHELTGDAHLHKGDVAAARDAYQRALDALEPGDAGRALLKLKLDDLGE